MKKYIATFTILLMLVMTMTGCINSGFDDIDTYSGADVSSFEGVYYRYTTDKIINVSGEPEVRQQALQMVSPVIDAEACTASITVRPSSNFPADQLAKLSNTNLVVCLNISVASVIKPVSGSARLGVPADWSKPNMYVITAGDGTTKQWTVTVTLEK